MTHPILDAANKKGVLRMSETTIQTRALTLQFIWGIRLRLRAEGAKLYAEGAKLYAEGDKLYAEGTLEVHGNITMDWQWRVEKQDYACILETGERFEP